MVIVLLYSCAAVRKQNVKIVLVRNKDKLEFLQILCIRHKTYAAHEDFLQILCIRHKTHAALEDFLQILCIRHISSAAYLDCLHILCIRHNSYAAHLLFGGPLHIGLGVSHLHSAWGQSPMTNLPPLNHAI